MSLPRPPPLSRNAAIFLDVDGTLLEIAPTPDAVVVPARLIEILDRLQMRLGGALALVSGRPIAALDQLFAPLKLPAAGIHGLERRGASGIRHVAPGDAAALDAARRSVAIFSQDAGGVVIEDKGLSLAIHYRHAPERESAIHGLAQRLAAQFAGRLQIQRGKMVVELRPVGPDKGSVVDAFMAEALFAGRIPAFVGDDATDEHGFIAVNRLHGMSIRVGATEATAARYAVASVGELFRWLDHAAGRARQH